MFTVEKPAGASRRYQFDLTRALWALWRGGQEYTLGQFVRPPVPNGFEYECTNAGQSLPNEPDWSTTIAEAFNDGSVEWTCRDFGYQASDTIASVNAVADAGLTVADVSFDEVHVNLKASGGTRDNTYDIEVTVTTNDGEVYVLRLQVTIIE